MQAGRARHTAQHSPEIILPAHPPLPTFETLAGGGATAMDDKLVPWQADRNALSNLSLTPWENTLARETYLTRVNAKACR